MLQMQGNCEKEDGDCLPTGIFELPGEPAVVINGVPDVSVTDKNVVPITSVMVTDKPSSDTDKPRNTGFGEWLEGREVQKKFGDRYYFGTVTEFDKETGWYRVVYEDGDFEDLEWHELQVVLQPLDITLPLKSLALKMLRKNEKADQGSGRVVGERMRATRSGGSRGSSIK